MTLYESKLQTLFNLQTTERTFPIQIPFQTPNTTLFPHPTVPSEPKITESSRELHTTSLITPFTSIEPFSPNNSSDTESSTLIPFTTSAPEDKLETTEFYLFTNSTNASDFNETIHNISSSSTVTPIVIVTLQAPPYTLDLLLFPIILISFLSLLINIFSLHLVLTDYNLSIRKHPTNTTIISLSLSNILGIIFIGFASIVPHKICFLQAFIETFYSSVCLLSLCLICLDRVAATRNVLYYNIHLKDNFIHSMLLTWVLSALLSLVDVNLVGVEKVILTTHSFVCSTKPHYFHLYKTLPVLSISGACVYLLVKAKQKSSTIGIRVMHEPYNTRYPIDNLFTQRKFRIPTKPQKDKVTLNYVLLCSLYLTFHAPTLITFISKLASPHYSSLTSLNYISILFETLSCSLTLTNYFIRPDFKQAFHAFMSHDY